MITKARYREMAGTFECARLLLTENRWIQHRQHWAVITPSGKESHGYCLVGAVYHCTPTPFRQPLDETLVLSQLVGEGPVVWNDKRGRRKREVLAVLEQARDLCLARGTRVKKGASA